MTNIIINKVGDYLAKPNKSIIEKVGLYYLVPLIVGNCLMTILLLGSGISQERIESTMRSNKEGIIDTIGYWGVIETGKLPRKGVYIANNLIRKLKGNKV